MDKKKSNKKSLVDRALATSEGLKNNKENEESSENLGIPASSFYRSSPAGWRERHMKTSSIFSSPSPPRRSLLLDTNFKSPPSRSFHRGLSASPKFFTPRPLGSEDSKENGVPMSPAGLAKKHEFSSHKDPHRIGFPNAGNIMNSSLYFIDYWLDFTGFKSSNN